MYPCAVILKIEDEIEDRDIESNPWHDNRKQIELWNQWQFTPLELTLCICPTSSTGNPLSREHAYDR